MTQQGLVVEAIRKYARMPKGRGLTGINLLDDLTNEIQFHSQLQFPLEYAREIRKALMMIDLFVVPGTAAHKLFLR